MAQTKVLISTDPTTQMVTVGQGLVEQTFKLDPWPSTDAEIEAQAFAAVSDVDDDMSKIPVPPNFAKQVTEL